MPDTYGRKAGKIRRFLEVYEWFVEEVRKVYGRDGWGRGENHAVRGRSCHRLYKSAIQLRICTKNGKMRMPSCRVFRQNRKETL